MFDQETLNDSHIENTKHVALRTEFRNQLEAAKKGGITAVRALAFENNDRELFASELTSLFTHFRNEGDFENMLRLYETSENPDFKNSPLIREQLMVAHNKQGNYKQTLAIGQGLEKDGLVNGEVYAAQGKAHFERSKIAKNCMDAFASGEGLAEAKAKFIEEFEITPDEAPVLSAEQVQQSHKNCLELAHHKMEQGFLHEFEYYPGINASYRLVDLGRINEARELATVVRLACLKEGGHQTNDYWCSSTLLESTCLAGASQQDLDEGLKVLSQYDVPTWQKETTISALQHVRGQLLEQGEDVSSFDYILPQLEQQKNQQIAKDTVKRLASSGAERLVEKTYSYRGLASNFNGANYVTGNIMYGGQLYDHTVTREDMRLFKEFLSAPIAAYLDPSNLPESVHPEMSLEEISSTEDFLKVSDLVVRQAFNTDQMQLEDLHSEGHAEFDQTVGSLIQHSAVNKGCSSQDSRTNIAVSFALGLGDCRHHAQAKQMLFDAWQKGKMNAELSDALQAIRAEDPLAYIEAEAEFTKHHRTELRTLDAQVMAPIVMNSPYDARTDAEGNYIADEQENLVEEHTMNILVQRDRSGEIETIKLADSFYQNHYSWGHGEVDPESIKINKSGEAELPAKSINAGEQSVPVKLVPTAYAGQRDAVAPDEYGQLLLVGCEVDKDFNLAQELAEQKSWKQRFGPLNEWAQEREKTLTKQAQDPQEKQGMVL